MWSATPPCPSNRTRARWPESAVRRDWSHTRPYPRFTAGISGTTIALIFATRSATAATPSTSEIAIRQLLRNRSIRPTPSATVASSRTVLTMRDRNRRRAIASTPMNVDATTESLSMIHASAEATSTTMIELAVRKPLRETEGACESLGIPPFLRTPERLC